MSKITAINAAATREKPRELHELTADELDQIAGDASIPIPPPKPHGYAIGLIEARFPTLT